jgi:ribonuclease HIII
VHLHNLIEPEHNATVNYEVLKDTKELTDTKVEALEAFLKLLTDAKFERLLAD